jgi:glycerol-3-phosphate dehydrogenase
MAGVQVGMFPSKGALLIFAHRVNNMVINRCRKPSNADILVPGDTVCIIGTTSTRIPLENCHKVSVTPDEVTLLVTEGAKLTPALSETRILRAFAGVRPLVSDDNDPTGRNISRGIVCLDHETRDGLKGFVTITGGKLTTYRLMAEMATDLVCSKLGVNKACETATTPLPGSEGRSYEELARQIWEAPSTAQKAATARLGSVVSEVPKRSRQDEALVCECEEVPGWEVNNAFERMGVSSLTDLRRRTRVGMGTCQGKLCSCRAASLLGEFNHDVKGAQEDLATFLDERWKGMRPVAWGDTLREAQLTAAIYEGLCGLDTAVNIEGKEDAQ